MKSEKKRLVKECLIKDKKSKEKLTAWRSINNGLYSQLFFINKNVSKSWLMVNQIAYKPSLEALLSIKENW